jgi:hypothetical protein
MRWKSIAGGAALIWTALDKMLSYIEHGRTIFEAWKNPEWMRSMMDFFFGPPGWAVSCATVGGLLLIAWDFAVRRPIMSRLDPAEEARRKPLVNRLCEEYIATIGKPLDQDTIAWINQRLPQIGEHFQIARRERTSTVGIRLGLTKHSVLENIMVTGFDVGIDADLVESSSIKNVTVK